MNKFLLVVLVLPLASGCAHRIADLSILGRRQGPEISLQRMNKGEIVRGESCRKSILFIPITSKPDLSDAVDNALSSSPNAVALGDVTIREKKLTTVIYNERCYQVEGAPLAATSK